MQATRALLRRRLPLTRTRAELLAHVQHTTSQSNLPDLGQELAYKANRDSVAARCLEPAVQQSVAVALALLDSYETWPAAVAGTRSVEAIRCRA